MQLCKRQGIFFSSFEEYFTPVEEFFSEIKMSVIAPTNGLYEETKNPANNLIKIDANGNDISSEEDSLSSTSDSFEDDDNETQEELRRLTRYKDGSLKLRNPHIEQLESDVLYHLAIGSASHNLEEMFGDVKFVCMGGTPQRMKDFAYYVMKEIGHKLPAGTTLQDISELSGRYAMYKVGPVLSVSHGMGVPSIGILLHEVIKLMYHAKCKDPTFFRIGTCGGIGIEGGTVVVSKEGIDGCLKNTYEVAVLGKIVSRPAKLDQKLAHELMSLANPERDGFATVMGKTMCANDFYEGQGRLDGAICDFTEKDKMNYLRKCSDFGIVNIEMEATIFSALTHHAGIKAAIVCVALLNRLKGDQVSTPKDIMLEWQKRPQALVSRYIRKKLRLAK